MKKTYLSLLLILTMLFAALGMPISAIADVAAPPEIGEVVYGFRTLDTYEIPLMGATCYIMEHEKTGATLAYIACEDTNRVFSISFRTPAVDDKGIPHVFEHATLCGSEKYPDPSLFFSMMSQTYNTFLNAMTMQTCTTFPSASLSEEQLFRFMDYTLSGVFYPTIMTDERAMMREAYRYELADKDADITLTGTVYSEMQGALTLNTQAANHIRKQLYPGSITANNAGGDPSVIPTITHQELKDFHDTYYHPSNSLIMLYGKLDYARFLKMIDEDYLSAFDRREISLADEAYQPYEGYREAMYTYPVARDANATPVASYGFALQGATAEACILLDIAMTSLMVEGSPMHKLLKEKLPDVMLTTGIDPFCAEPMLAIMGINISEADAQVFKSVIDEVIAGQIADGLDMERIRAICRQKHYDDIEKADNPMRGSSFVMDFASMWGRHGDIDECKTHIDVMARLNEYAETDAFNEAFREFMTNPVRSAFVVTVPEPGGLERQSAQLKQSLADRKAAMTDEEIEALISRTADFAAWTAANAESSMIDQIKVVDAQNLPEEVVAFEAQTNVINGMRVITSQVEVDDLIDVSLQFDASVIPFELLQAYALFASLLGEMPTQSRDMDEIAQAFSNLTFTNSISPDMIHYADGGYRPVMNATWCTTLGQLSDSFSLIEDVLFFTDFSDADLMRMRAVEYGQLQRLLSTAMPDMFMEQYAYTLTSEGGAYSEYIKGMPFIRLMKRLETMPDEEIARYAEQMHEVRDLLLHQGDFFVTCVGGAEAIDAAIAQAGALHAKLDSTPREAADYSALPPLPETPLAIAVDGTVQFNAQAINFDDCGFEDNGKMYAMRSLVHDKLLVSILRFQNAAYGAGISLSKPVVNVSSYRDPNLAETFEVFAQLGDLIRELKLSQDDLDGYISRMYATLAMPYGQLSGGVAAVEDAITGKDTFGDTLRYMREIKQFSLEDVRAYAAIFDTLAEKGVQIAVGGMEAIRENSDMFKTIITDFVEE